MSRIVFNELIVEGFNQIVKPIRFSLDRGGMWFIRGENGNGKTTIFSSLIWAIYKTNLRGVVNDRIPSWNWLRTDEWRGTRVVLDFSKDGYDYRIARHIKFKGTTLGIEGNDTLMIFKKESEQLKFTEQDLIGEEQFKGDQQEYIDKLMGMDSKAFLNSVLFGQRMKRLIEADNTEKRKLFETLFEMDFVGVAKDKADKEFKRLTAELQEIDHKINIKNIEIANKERELEEKAENNAKLLSKKELEIKEASDYLLELEEARVKLQNSIKSLKETAGTYDDKLDKMLSKQLEELNSQKLKLSNRQLSIKENFIKNKNEKYEKIFEDLENQISELKSEKSSRLEQLEKEADIIKNDISSVEDELSELEKIKRDCISKLDDYETNIAKNNRSIATKERELEDIKTDCPSCRQKLPEGDISFVKQNINQEIQNLKNSTSLLEKSKVTLNKNKEETEQHISTVSDKLSKHKEQLQMLRDKYATLRDDTREISAKTEELNSKKAESNSLTVERDPEYQKIQENLDNLESSIASKNNEISNLESLAENYNKHLSNIKDKEDELLKIETLDSSKRTEYEKLINSELDLEDLEKIKDVLETMKSQKHSMDSDKENKEKELVNVKWWNTTGFSSNGLKSFIFSAMLSQLNDNAEKYSNRLGIRAKFSIDLSKASKPFNTKCFMGDKEIMYEELSGGQKQRIDIIMALALHDVISINSDISILIFDEVMEGLDELGRSLIIDLMKQKAESKTVFVISHADIIEALGVKYINVSKDSDNHTMIEE